tara:strand:+ start:806 stop:1480 length:675 start_codon:yes stop_codon:yes gene_type:complete
MQSHNNAKKRMALIFFGISYIETTKNIKCHGPNRKIDFTQSVQNYQDFIFNFYKDYDIDIFMCTNDSIKKELLFKYYPPTAYCFSDEGRNIKIIKAVELCLNYSETNNVTYDHILITRFDLWFRERFEDANIDYNKLNVVSKLEKRGFICDNLYIFPHKYLNKFHKILINGREKYAHNLMVDFDKAFDVNYIRDQGKNVRKLAFYKLRRDLVDNHHIKIYGKFD